MSTLNQVTLQGKIGKDPEVKEAKNTKFMQLSVATDDYAGKDGNKAKYETTWHDVVLFGDQAEFVEKYFLKGDTITLVGSYRKRTYTNKDGVKVTVAEMKPQQVIGFGSKQNKAAASAGSNGGNAHAAAASNVPDEDIPF